MVLVMVLLAPALSDNPDTTSSGTAGSVIFSPLILAEPVFFKLYVSLTESPAFTEVLLIERVKVSAACSD